MEIARAVLHNAKVIIFDEPTATLTPEEKKYFFDLVRELKQRGVSIIFISHALEEALADRRPHHRAARRRACRHGRHREVRSRTHRPRDGRPRPVATTLWQAQGDRAPGRRAKVLSVQNLSMGRSCRNNSFSVFAGQITGIFGLVGSGRTETVKVVSGVLKRDFFHGGEMLLRGRPVRYRVPRPAVRDGIVYVTEDRKVEGFFETMSIAENIYLGLLAKLGRRDRCLSAGKPRCGGDGMDRGAQHQARSATTRR